MSAAETVPQYLSLEPTEGGSSLGIDFETYRRLAGAALSITRNIPWFMGIYRLPDGRGCALDIFTADRCATIVIDSDAEQLGLWLCADLDSPSAPECILSVSNSKSDWKRLQQAAHRALSQ
jgi:hypothetical protein